jgi:exonuclease III
MKNRKIKDMFDKVTPRIAKTKQIWHKKFKMATLNVRGLIKEGKRQQLERWAQKRNLKIVLLQETHINHNSTINSKNINQETSDAGGDWHWFYSSSVLPKDREIVEKLKKNNRRPTVKQASKAREYGGVGCMIHNSIRHLIEDVKPVNGRLMVITVKGNPKLKIINSYSPQADMDNAEMKSNPSEENITAAQHKFAQQENIKSSHYENINAELDLCKMSRQLVILAGDFNAKLHQPLNELEETVLGKNLWGADKEGILKMSKSTRSNREHLINTAVNKHMVIRNSFFKKHPKLQITRVIPGKPRKGNAAMDSHEILDHWLVPKQWFSSILDVTTRVEDDVDSDHIPSIATIKMKYREKKLSPRSPTHTKAPKVRKKRKR